MLSTSKPRSTAGKAVAAGRAVSPRWKPHTRGSICAAAPRPHPPPPMSFAAAMRPPIPAPATPPRPGIWPTSVR